MERHLGLDAIKTHLKTYPQFSQEGHKYQIPKDFYDKLQSYLSMSEETANRLPREDRTLWKYIQTFFSETGLEPNDIEPAAFDYNDAQRDRIDRTLDKEQTQIKKTDQEKRNAAIQQSNPTLKEGIQATAVSAGIEGGITLLLTISKKLKQGRHLSEFTEEDWKDVGLNTAGGTVKGAVRGATVYGLTNFSATPAPVASALVSAIFGVVGQAYQLQQGALSADEFVANSEVICMDVAVGAVSSLIGQVAIPIPVLGAIVGNAVGMFLNGIAKDHLGKQEQALILSYTEKIEQLNRKLDAKYRQLLEELKQEFAKFTSILDLAFDLSVNIAFNGSIQLADYSGVPQEKVLRNRSDIDNFFLS